MGSEIPSHVDVAAKWEKRLAKEGMAAEVGPDKGAEAMRKQALEERLGESAEQISNEMRLYWLTRSPLSTWGDHKHAARRIAGTYNIEPSAAVEVMENLQDEMGRAEGVAREIAEKIWTARSAVIASYPEAFRKQVIAKLRDQYPQYSWKVRAALASGAIRSFLDRYGVN